MPIYVKLKRSAQTDKKAPKPIQTRSAYRTPVADNRVLVTIPDTYYRVFEVFRSLPNKRPYYRKFRELSDRLARWLSGQAPGSYKVIGFDGSTFILEKTPREEYGYYWTVDAKHRLSEHCGL